MLYHKELGFGKLADNLYGKSFRLNYSHHSKLAAVNDRYGPIEKPPFNLTITKDNLIEIETNSFGGVVKAVVRLSYDTTRDIALAVIPDFNVATVKSIWANLKNDTHFTLDKSKYNKP